MEARLYRVISCAYRLVPYKSSCFQTAKFITPQCNGILQEALYCSSSKESQYKFIRRFNEKTQTNISEIEKQKQEPIPTTLYGKLKYYFRRYWYIALCVHLGLYVIWFGAFFIIVQAGVDVISILEKLHVPKSWIEKIKSVPQAYSSLMIAFILCKLIMPLRYVVSIISIKYIVAFLTKRGLLRTTKEVRNTIRKNFSNTVRKIAEKNRKKNGFSKHH